MGLLDDRYFAYVEDMDYCVRAMNAGFATRLERRASVYHRHGFALAGPDAHLREYLITRNEYLFWTTHLRGWSRWSYRMRYIRWVLRRWIDARLRGQPQVEACIATRRVGRAAGALGIVGAPRAGAGPP